MGRIWAAFLVLKARFRPDVALFWALRTWLVLREVTCKLALEVLSGLGILLEEGLPRSPQPLGYRAIEEGDGPALIALDVIGLFFGQLHPSIRAEANHAGALELI